jgi:hypothetical protein
VGFLDRSVPSGTHVCAFVSGPEQRDEIVMPFLVLDNPDGRAEFFRYEARLTSLVARFSQVILCLYDLRRFGAEVLWTHCARTPWSWWTP